MTFQSTVRNDIASGVVGDIAFLGPLRSKSFILNSGDADNNVIGRAFTGTGTEGEAQAGGTGPFLGLLVNSKVYPSYGTIAGTLEPTLALANNQQAEIMGMGEAFVALPAAASAGDILLYATATGILSSMEAVVAATASQATTVLTVSAITAGKIGVGSIIKNAAGEILGEVIALGTGTGGTGTYTLNTSATVGSAAISANSVAPSGKAIVPNGVVSYFDAVSPGYLAVAKLTD
jgi:hypothetical protein